MNMRDFEDVSVILFEVIGFLVVSVARSQHSLFTTEPRSPRSHPTRAIANCPGQAAPRLQPFASHRVERQIRAATSRTAIICCAAWIERLGIVTEFMIADEGHDAAL